MMGAGYNVDMVHRGGASGTLGMPMNWLKVCVCVCVWKGEGDVIKNLLPYSQASRDLLESGSGIILAKNSRTT